MGNHRESNMASISRIDTNLTREELRARGTEAVRRFRAKEKIAKEKQKKERERLTIENQILAEDIKLIEAQLGVYEDLYTALNQATQGRFGQNTGFDFGRRSEDEMVGNVPAQSSGFLSENTGFQF